MRPIILTGKVAPHAGVSPREGLACLAVGIGAGLIIALGLFWQKGLLAW